MAPPISPWVPQGRTTDSSHAATGWRFASIAKVLSQLRFLLLFSPFLLLTSALIAQSPERVEVGPPTFWTNYKWLVVIAIATFLIQAFLIGRLLLTQARLRRAEIESRRLANLGAAEHKRLKEVVSNVPGIVWEARIDPVTHKQKATYVSEYAEKVLGYSPEEWIATPGFALQLVHPEDRDRVIREVEGVFATAEPRLIEFRWIAKNGNTVWAQAHVAPLVDDGGANVVGVRGVTIDVTERLQAEKERRESEERFSKSFRSNPQPMSITRLSDGLYLDVNESFLAMSGYTREEVMGRTALELGIWGTKERRDHFIQQLIKDGSIVNYEAKFYVKDGSARVLLSSAERLQLGGQDCLLVASSDITERVAAQRALRDSEARFRDMADTAPVMIWISSDEQKCTYVNNQWLDFTGRSIEEQLGFGWAESIHIEDRERSLKALISFFEERKPFELEYRLRRHDGEYRWIFDKGAPRYSSDGSFLGYIGTCIDITERIQSEVDLRKAHQELASLTNQLEAENIYLQEELQLDKTSGEIVGQSDALKYVLFKIAQVAPTDTTVLITGETGTGKELVARAVHAASSRKDRPLIKVNCGALAPTLIESELFGHEKGAFTGAAARKLGRFELANGGTIFLDEIGDLPTELQVKLLRVIQENEFERLGGTKTIKADVRIIAATNRNLKFEVEHGRFREDLWYRLNVYPITVPPLRQRKEDIPLLVEHFVNSYAKKFGKTITSVSPRALQRLQSHSWPGNVRELANSIERAVIHAKGHVLTFVDRFEEPIEEPAFSVKTLEEVEREYILRTLESTGWRIEGTNGAANILGLNPSTLRTRMAKLGIQRRTTAA